MNITEVATQKLKKENEELKAQVAALKTKIAGRQAEVDEEKVHLQAKLSVTQSQLVKLVKREQKVAEYVAEVKQAVKALDPLPRASFIKPKKAKTPMTAVIHLTDWHIGEVVRPQETEGWGNFDWQIAVGRVLEQLVPQWLKWLDTQRSGYIIDKITMLCTGDFISGDIHDELRRTNEFPIPVQTANAGDLLGHVARELAAHCEALEVIEIGADNHSRLVQKPQAKQKAQNSMSFLAYHILNKEVSRHSNATVNQAEGMKLLFNINGHPFLGEHGDTVKSWQGVPWYGMEREVAREAKRRMFDGRGFKHVVMGHFHQSFFGPYIIGGSLTGTNEYDHSCGRQAPPHQTGFLVGKRGPFGFVPFELR